MRSDELIEELQQAIDQAKPVPLTDQVRIERDRFRELLAELKAALEEERRR